MRIGFGRRIDNGYVAYSRSDMFRAATFFGSLLYGGDKLRQPLYLLFPSFARNRSGVDNSGVS